MNNPDKRREDERTRHLLTHTTKGGGGGGANHQTTLWVRQPEGGEKERDHLMLMRVSLCIRSIELTKRTTPATQRTGRDLRGAPTGCVRLLFQAAHVGHRPYAQPKHHHKCLPPYGNRERKKVRGRERENAGRYHGALMNPLTSLNEPCGSRRARRQAPGRDVMLGRHLARRNDLQDPTS